MPTREDSTMDDFDGDYGFDHFDSEPADIDEDGRDWADSDRGEDRWLDGSYEADDDPATCEHPDPLERFGWESDVTDCW